MSSSISFISFLWFSVYRFFTSLVRFIPRYFMLFGAIVSGIDSLISLYVASLLVYRNATDFCTLTLYPETLLNSRTYKTSNNQKNEFSLLPPIDHCFRLIFMRTLGTMFVSYLSHICACSYLAYVESENFKTGLLETTG